MNKSKSLKITTGQFGMNVFVPNEFTVIEKEVQSFNRLLESIHNQLELNKTKLPSVNEEKHSA
ncbi:hypothetical protein ACI2OX_17015 [Bacillus sp. N9]